MVKHLMQRFLYIPILVLVTLLTGTNCAEKLTDLQAVKIKRSIEEINALINARFTNITCCDKSLTSWKDACSHIQKKHTNKTNDITCPACNSIKLSAPSGLSCYLYCCDSSFFCCNFCDFMGKDKDSLIKHLKYNHLTENLIEQTQLTNKSPVNQLATLVVTKKNQRKTLNLIAQNQTLYKCSVHYICNPYNKPITQDLQSEHF